MTIDREPSQRLAETNPGLRALQESSFSAERLEHNKQAILASINKLPMGRGTSQSHIGIISIGGLLVFAAWQWSADSPPVETAGPPMSHTHHVETTHEKPAHKIPMVDHPENPDGGPLIAGKSDHRTTHVATPTEELGKFKHQRKAPLRTRRDAATPSRPAPPATLGDELSQFENARQDFDAGHYGQAHRALTRMVDMYPQHSLGPEVMLLWARIHLQAGRPQEALKKMAELMETPGVKMRGQWFKLLGDIHKARKTCGAALIAYSKALKMGLTPEQAEAVRVAVRNCD